MLFGLARPFEFRYIVIKEVIIVNLGERVTDTKRYFAFW